METDTAGNSRDDAGPTRPLTEAELSGWLNFLNAHTSLTRQLDAVLQSGHRISLAEHTVLQQLALGGGHLRMSELADLVHLSPSGTSRLVDRLVADGLIERQSCDPDGRAVHAVITERGRGRLAGAGQAYAAALRRLFVDQFTGPEYEVLAGLLLRVAPACRSRQGGTRA